MSKSKPETKRPRLIDAVRELLPNRKGFAPWHEKLDPEILAEITEIRRQWLAGEMPATKTRLAHSLSQALTDRGVPIGFAGVLKWLEKA